MKDGKSEVVNTKYGFIWGPASVERVADLGKGGVIVTVIGTRGSIDIRVTPGGRVKIDNKSEGIA